MVSFDRNLRGVGNVGYPAEFFPDGSIVELERPEDQFLGEPQGRPLYAHAWDVSESGYAVGEAQFSDILRLDGAIWTPEGEFSFIEPRIAGPHAGAGSVRDRNDGKGVNIGFLYTGRVKYGDEPFIDLYESGTNESIDGSMIVSQGEFAVVNVRDSSFVTFLETFVYYPGIVPGEPGAALPIVDVFPELDTVDFAGASDLYAVDGRIYMTLYGDDGLYLFGARDPSVIPEPSTLMLLVIAAGASVWRCRSWGLGIQDGRAGER